MQFRVAPENVHVVVQFDCHGTVTGISGSDSQAFCLLENLQKVSPLFLLRVREKLT